MIIGCVVAEKSAKLWNLMDHKWFHRVQTADQAKVPGKEGCDSEFEKA